MSNLGKRLIKAAQDANADLRAGKMLVKRQERYIDLLYKPEMEAIRSGTDRLLGIETTGATGFLDRLDAANNGVDVMSLTVEQWVTACLIEDGRYTMDDIVGWDRSEDESGDLNIRLEMSDGESFPIKLNAARH